MNAGRLPGKLTEECHSILRRFLNHAMSHIEDVFPRPCLLEAAGDFSPYHILQDQEQGIKSGACTEDMSPYII